MSYAFALLLAKLLTDAAALFGSSAPASILSGREFLETTGLYFTAAAAIRCAGAGRSLSLQRALGVAMAASGFVYSLADGASIHFLQADIAHSAGNLLSLNVDARDLAYYATQYVTPPVLLAAAAGHIAACAAFGRGSAAAPRWRWALPALVLLQWAGLNRVALAEAVIHRVGGSAVAANRSYLYAVKPISGAPHHKPVPHPQLLAGVETVVLFINESIPRYAPDSAGARGNLLRGIFGAVAPRSGPWIEFPEARTNASVTDISVPSILTGAGPVEGTDKLQALPFVFNLAKAAGYRTAFFTSQDYRWYNFHTFYSSAAIDTYVTGDRLGLPKVNDSGIDDMQIADRVAAYLRTLKRGERTFLVVNTNAWHVPFQDRSEAAPPAALTDRRCRAAYILEHVYAEIFSALESGKRLQGALVLVTSDHGEGDPLRPRPVDRIHSHFEEVANVPFFIHLPAAAPRGLVRQAERNARLNIENEDIAPTLADCFGFGPPADLPYAGFSLLRPMPADRLGISLSSCEWKRWTEAAFGLSQGDERLIFVENRGAFLYDLRIDPLEEHPFTSGERLDRYLQTAASIPTLEEMLLRTDLRGVGG